MGELERIDGERRAVGAVEDVEHRAGYGGEEEEEQDREGRPEAARAAAAAAVAPPLWRRLRAVGRARGVVHLRLVRRERRGGLPVRRRRSAAAVGGWLRRWVHFLAHLIPC